EVRAVRDGGERRLDVLDGASAGGNRGNPAERRVDHLLEPVERAIGQSLPIDEDRWRADDVGTLALLLLARDLREHLRGLHVLLELHDVELEALRELGELLGAQIALIAEEEVMHLPVLALPARSKGRLRPGH